MGASYPGLLPSLGTRRRHWGATSTVGLVLAASHLIPLIMII